MLINIYIKKMSYEVLNVLNNLHIFIKINFGLTKQQIFIQPYKIIHC